MSNIAGKAYAMNVVTPLGRFMVYVNKLIFWLAGTRALAGSFEGLKTLSMIHYARWVIIKPKDFPRLSDDQPKEELNYSYMLFFSNFNGSWEQYVDSFHMSIPDGLDLLWYKNINYPGSVPLTNFHNYITSNQVWTEHYYNAYPLAASNDVKAAVNLKSSLEGLGKDIDSISDQAFKKQYDNMLFENQAHIAGMNESEVVSMANEAVEERLRLNSQQACKTEIN